MNYALLKTSPFVAVLTTQDIKLHSRIDGMDEDPLLAIFIPAVQDWCEGVTGRPLGGACTYQMTFDAFEDSTTEVILPRAPLISLDSLKYLDPDTGTQMTLDPTTYRAPIDGSARPRVAPEYLTVWPNVRLVIGAIQINFTAGYTDDSDPLIAALKLIMIKMVSNWYEFRESVSAGRSIADLPGASGFHALLQPYIVPSFGAGA